MSDPMPEVGHAPGKVDPPEPVGSAAGVERFVLDQASNPHPRMLAEALAAQRDAIEWDTVRTRSYYAGFMAAMAAATGCSVGELLAWMDRHKGQA